MLVNDIKTRGIQETKVRLGFVFVTNRLTHTHTFFHHQKFNPMIILTFVLLLLLIFGNKALKQA